MSEQRRSQLNVSYLGVDLPEEAEIEISKNLIQIRVFDKVFAVYERQKEIKNPIEVYDYDLRHLVEKYCETCAGEPLAGPCVNCWITFYRNKLSKQIENVVK
jgi:hypothetical protein